MAKEKYEVVAGGAHNAKNEPFEVGQVIEIESIPSFLVGKVRKVSNLATSDESEEVKALKAENEALKAELESLKKAPELDLEAATPKQMAKK